jgi:hypothetical protein
MLQMGRRGEKLQKLMELSQLHQMSIGFKAMEVPVVDVVANGAAIQDKMMMKKRKAESQTAVHSQG